jgi:hypothetical protein
LTQILKHMIRYITTCTSSCLVIKDAYEGRKQFACYDPQKITVFPQIVSLIKLSVINNETE